MFFKEYLSKCDDEAKKLIPLYLTFMYKITNIIGEVESKYLPINYNINIHGNKKDTALFFLFMIYFHYSSTMKKLKHGDFFSLNIPTAGKLKDIFYGTHDFLVEYEKVFQENSYATYFIKAYSDSDKPICMERILLNIIKDGNLDSDRYNDWHLNIDKLTKHLENILHEKEKGIDSTSSSSKLPKTMFNPEYGINLTAINYPYNPLIGRQKEYRKICAMLMDEEKSLIIHGNPGVGKTSIVKGLAYKIQHELVPKALQGKQIIEISSAQMIRDCRYIGMVQDRILKLIESLLDKNCILFIDEIHTLINLGIGENSHDSVDNILKPYLGDGRIKIIGATTTEEYNIILEDGAFSRRFNELNILEPSDLEILEILRTYIERKKDEGIEVDAKTIDKVLSMIINFSHKQMAFQKKLYNPDLALSILRNGYNYAKLEDTGTLEPENIAEGIDSMSYFNDTQKKEFRKEILSLKKQSNLKLL